MRWPVLLPVIATLLSSCSDSEPPTVPLPGGTVALVVIDSGLSDPLFLTAPANDQRLFVVERGGRIWIRANGLRLPTAFLDISSQVSTGGEQGLLGLAFHPDYATNGFFYVSFTNTSGDSRIIRYTVSGNPNIANAASSKLILAVAQPFPNHNGGMIAFGPDGMLYLGLGDGGSANDPQGNGQNRATLLGDLLRIDVNVAGAYAIPPDNPFVGPDGALDEICAYGLRNPWRFSFDHATGDIYLGDVGQGRREEIDVVSSVTGGGTNFGWVISEGTLCVVAGCSTGGQTLPVTEYSHADGCSVTGGYVYRGATFPAIVGHYFYSDYCSGWLRSFKYTAGTVTDTREWSIPGIGKVTSFGEDANRELYILAESGRIYRIVRID